MQHIQSNGNVNSDCKKELQILVTGKSNLLSQVQNYFLYIFYTGPELKSIVTQLICLYQFFSLHEPDID